jgi:hypothetical protein
LKSEHHGLCSVFLMFLWCLPPCSSQYSCQSDSANIRVKTYCLYAQNLQRIAIQQSKNLIVSYETPFSLCILLHTCPQHTPMPLLLIVQLALLLPNIQKCQAWLHLPSSAPAAPLRLEHSAPGYSIFLIHVFTYTHLYSTAFPHTFTFDTVSSFDFLSLQLLPPNTPCISLIYHSSPALERRLPEVLSFYLFVVLYP